MTVAEQLVRIVRLMVDDRDAVGVEEIPSRSGPLYRLRVADEDLGKVIGRQGRTARALRTVLAARGPGNLDILD